MGTADRKIIEDTEYDSLWIQNGRAHYAYYDEEREDFYMFTFRTKAQKKRYKYRLRKKSNSVDKYLLISITDERIREDISEFLQRHVGRIENPAYNNVKDWYTTALSVDGGTTVKIERKHQWYVYAHILCKNCGQPHTNILEEIQSSYSFFPSSRISLNPYRCVCLYMNEIKAVQRFLKKRLLYKRLVSLIPEVTAIYYSPGCKGEFLAKHAFEKTASCT
jgi:translation initiation factor 2 beta subunit (eIF-2beta)/eIF-5